MGAILRWKIPNLLEVSYTHAIIYRSTEPDANFTEIARQEIEDNTYFDIDGSTGLFYKIRFYDSVNDKYSEYSNVLQYGDFTTYATADEVRAVANLPDTVTDNMIYQALEMAQAIINREISSYIDEPVSYIGIDKQNIVDGSNKVFYVTKPFIGDADDDGTVDKTDVTFYGINYNTGEKVIFSVKSVDPKEGKIELNEAPTPDVLCRIKYRSCNVMLDPPDGLIRQACAILAGSYLLRRLEGPGLKSFRVGNVSVTRETNPAILLRREFNELISKIKSIVRHEKAEPVM